MRLPLTGLGVFLLSATFVAQTCFIVLANDWQLYAGSTRLKGNEPTLIDWYESNRLLPVPEAEAWTLHYYDQNSVASYSPFGGGPSRILEKSVVRGETPSYENALNQIEREEEKRLNRKFSVLDMARLFPLAVRKAAKEVVTQYEINCGEKHFLVYEVITYDTTGQKLTGQLNMDNAFWVTVQPSTVMEELFKKVCQ